MRRISNYSILVKCATEARYKTFRENQWGDRHFNAWQHPKVGSEAAIKLLLVGIAEYADHYHAATDFEPEEKLATDGYAGSYWLALVSAANNLLSMSLGRFDAGELNHALRDMVRNEGFTSLDL